MDGRMKTKGKLKWIEVTLLLALAVGLASGAMALQTGQELSDRVVRLHVLANSDSEEDQALKLKVRDRILADFGWFRRPPGGGGPAPGAPSGDGKDCRGGNSGQRL